MVDTVIVSADMGEMTLACLGELPPSLRERAVVVDNAFSHADGVGSRREQIGRLARTVELDRPLGFAAANNRGIALGAAPYVLLLNSDILLTPGAADTLLRELREDPGAVAAGGRLVDPDTLATQAGYRPRPFPTLANFAVVLLGIEERWPRNPVTRRYHGHSFPDSGVQVVDAQPAAAALLVRRDALAAIGGLDERFWFWFEDSDLLLRLRARGRILYVPDAAFRHIGGGSFARWSKAQQIRSVHHGILHYADAHFSYPARAALGVLVLATSAPRIALFSRSRPDEARAWRSVAAGALALLRGRPVPEIAPGE